MRGLTNDESRAVFAVLSHYIGANLIHLIDRAGQPYCFMHDGPNRVLYLPEALASSASTPPSATHFGTFTPDGRFALHVNALDHVAPYAKAKVWITHDGAAQFLRGYPVQNTHVRQMSKNAPAKHAAVVYTTEGVPLGFGVTTRAAVDLPSLGEFVPVVQHVADISQTGCGEVRSAAPALPAYTALRHY